MTDLKKMVTILLAGLVVFGCAAATPAAKGAARITKEEARAMLGRKDVVVIDVRAAADWNGSTEKIAGAVREEAENITWWARNYDKSKTIILYCA